MKIGILQCDVVSGDLAGNVERLAEGARQCVGADLILAPAMALTGPIMPCLGQLPAFREAVARAESALASALQNGPPLLHASTEGCRLLQNGMVIVPEEIFRLCGRRIMAVPLYGETIPKPKANVDILLCPAAIPFAGEPPAWQKWLDFASARTLPLVVCNLVGGYDGRIYPGGSLAADFNGAPLDILPIFQESARVVDEEQARGARPLPPWQWAEWIYGALTLGLRDFVAKCGASSVLLGLSGGMDSALVAALAAESLGAAKVTGLMMPSSCSSEGSLADSRELAKNLGIRTFELPIEGLVDGFEIVLAPVYERIPAGPGDVTRENIQARARGGLLAAASNRSGALVLNTGNKSEAAMGYFTLYGDSAGALAVIGDLYKTEVYELAAHINARAGRQIIPQNIFDKAPSAELAPGQKDSDTLPPYEALDPVLRRLLATGYAETAGELEIRRKLHAAEFKRRQCPPTLIVSNTPLAGCARPVAGKADWGGERSQ